MGLLCHGNGVWTHSVMLMGISCHDHRFALPQKNVMATEYGLTLSWSWAYRVMTLEYELAKSWPLSMGSTYH
eukprot:1144730-Pelagomonas_calceolata.AAC.2